MLVVALVGCGDGAAGRVVAGGGLGDAGMSGGDAGLPAADAGSKPDSGTSYVPSPLVAARPYLWRAPAQVAGDVALPLVVFLHGYSSSATETGTLIGLDAAVDARRFFYAAPDGSKDSFGNAFWNATAACCNFEGAPVDDVAYLSAVVADMQARFPIDPKRIYFVGHSNGAFMAQRMACERAGVVAAVISIAGAQNADVSRCVPSEPVPMVQLHGDADDTIEFDGGSLFGAPYPSAVTTVEGWAQLNGCSGALVPAGVALDLVSDITGAETAVSRFGGCPRGSVELWRMQGAGHAPSVQPTFAGVLLDWLLPNAKP